MITELLWRMTYNCNKHCSFCFNNVFDDKVDKTIHEETNIDAVIDLIKNCGAKKIYLSGGEPATVPNLNEIILKLADYVDVVLFTNGLLFEKYEFHEIGSLPLKSINISIDLSDIKNETPAFNKLLEAIEYIHGLMNNIKLNTQLMIDINYFDIINSNGYQRLSKSIDRIFWQPLTVPKSHLLYKSTIEGMDRITAIKILNDISLNSNNEMSQHINYIIDVLLGKTTDSCSMGNVYLTINPDLTLNKCPHINENSFKIEQYNEVCKHHEVCSRLSMRCVCLYSHIKRRY